MCCYIRTGASPKQLCMITLHLCCRCRIVESRHRGCFFHFAFLSASNPASNTSVKGAYSVLGEWYRYGRRLTSLPLQMALQDIAVVRKAHASLFWQLVHVTVVEVFIQIFFAPVKSIS